MGIETFVLQPPCIDCANKYYKEANIRGDIKAVPRCLKGHDGVITSIFTINDCPDKEIENDTRS